MCHQLGKIFSKNEIALYHGNKMLQKVPVFLLKQVA